MTYVPDALRNLVHQRADSQCEYCLLDERYTVKRHEVDHIYAEKHGGDSVESNLCLSCMDCNRFKGSDLCSLDPQTGEIVALFHPRRNEWLSHFRLSGTQIEPLTPQGRVTVRLLRLNDLVRLQEREILIRLKRYP